MFAYLGSKPVDEIDPPALLATMRKIEARGALETAHRALENCGQVFRIVILSEYGMRAGSNVNVFG